jgi:D-alanyl-D-alanine carboxypeptidase
MRAGGLKIAIMICLFGVAVGNTVFAANTPAGSVVVAAQPVLKSTAVLVMDEGSESVLYQQHADVAVPIASITKLMTALVVLEAGQSMDEVLQITAADRDTERGSTSRLAIGTRLTRAEMMQLALMASENRAAPRWAAIIRAALLP